MNIAVYVTSNYQNYDKLSQLLNTYLRKYTTTPVIITAFSTSTKPNHGNLLVKKYADDNRIKCKVYETNWSKWKKSAGSIASYHMNHNSERSIVFWDGLSKGCKNYLKMTQRLHRPCDLIRVNPNDIAEIKPKEPITPPKPTTQNNQQQNAQQQPQNTNTQSTSQNVVQNNQNTQIVQQNSQQNSQQTTSKQILTQQPHNQNTETTDEQQKSG